MIKRGTEKDEKFLMEHMRTIQTTIQFSKVSNEEKIRTIVVSSANKGDGKSFCALNLAKSFAASGKKTLLIDADLYNPRISRQLNYRMKLGLSNYLTDSEEYVGYIKKQSQENLFFLPSGLTSSAPTEVLESVKMDNLINHAKKSFDIVIFDTPPTLVLNDSRVIGSYCDGVILVVSSGKTKKHELLEAVNLIESANNKLLGVVLNRKKYSGKEMGSYLYY